MVRECRPPARAPMRFWLARRSTISTSTPRQRQLGRQHQPRRTASGDHHRMFGHNHDDKWGDAELAPGPSPAAATQIAHRAEPNGFASLGRTSRVRGGCLTSVGADERSVAARFTRRHFGVSRSQLNVCVM
jgi:hypothetical protein